MKNLLYIYFFIIFLIFISQTLVKDLTKNKMIHKDKSNSQTPRNLENDNYMYYISIKISLIPFKNMDYFLI